MRLCLCCCSCISVSGKNEKTINVFLCANERKTKFVDGAPSLSLCLREPGL